MLDLIFDVITQLLCVKLAMRVKYVYVRDDDDMLCSYHLDEYPVVCGSKRTEIGCLLVCSHDARRLLRVVIVEGRPRRLDQLGSCGAHLWWVRRADRVSTRHRVQCPQHDRSHSSPAARIAVRLPARAVRHRCVRADVVGHRERHL